MDKTKSDKSLSVGKNISYKIKYTFVKNNEINHYIIDASALYADEGSLSGGLASLLVKARDDETKIIAALYDKGYFAGQVMIKIDNVLLDDVFLSDKLIKKSNFVVTIHINKGAQFRFGKINYISVTNNLKIFPPLKNYGIKTGNIAGLGELSNAINRLVFVAKSKGYPYAKIDVIDLLADHKRKTLEVNLKFNSNKKAVFGKITVVGTKYVRPDYIKHVSRIPVGGGYFPKAIDNSIDFLRKLRVFESIRVKIAKKIDKNGKLPIRIELKDNSQFRVQGNLKWSTDKAGQIYGTWYNRRFDDKASRLLIKAGVGRIGKANNLGDYDLFANIKLSEIAAYNSYIDVDYGLNFKQEITESYRLMGAGAQLKLKREINKKLFLSLKPYLEFYKFKEDLEYADYILAGFDGHALFDMRDNKINPNKGYTNTFIFEPIYELKHKQAFIRAALHGSIYKKLPIHQKIILAARAGLGSTLGGDFDKIPKNKRYFMGGGQSIRGFEYQGLGPRNSQNKPIGGLSYFYSEVEARLSITDNIAVVPFLGAANVYKKRYPSLQKIRFAGGLGLRYSTPIGVLRIDLGFPFKRIYRDEGRYKLYFGFGQSF